MKNVLFAALLWAGVICYALPGRAQEFSRIYQIPAPGQPANQTIKWFDPKQVMIANSGDNHFVAGTIVNADSSLNIFVMKTDQSGNIIWSKEYGNTGISEAAKTLKVSPDSTAIVVIGKSSADPAGFIAFKITNNNGSLIWSRQYTSTGANLEFYTIVRRTTAGLNYYVLCGKDRSVINGRLLIKPAAIAINDQDGSVRWSNLYPEGQADYYFNNHHFITGFAIRNMELALTGKYYSWNAANSGLISLFEISALNGSLLDNNMSIYDLQNNPADTAISTGRNYVWEIAKVFHPITGAFAGHAIAGTYVSSPAAQASSEVAVLRLDGNNNPLWANRYLTSKSFLGFGRGIYQNQVMGKKQRLDLFTAHDQSQGGSNRVNGLLSVNMFNGNVIAYQGQTLNGITPGFLGASMTRIPANAGYLFLTGNTKIPGPDHNAFQLIAVDEDGRSMACEGTDTFETDSLSAKRTTIEIEKKPIEVAVLDYPMNYPDLKMITAPCGNNKSFRNSLKEEADTEKRKADFDSPANPTSMPGAGTNAPVMSDDSKGSGLPGKKGGIRIWPNPVASSLTVQFNALPAGKYQLKVMNMQGKQVLQRDKVYNDGSSVIDLDLSSFASGVYLLTISGGTIMVKQRIVKQ